jgi:hypothetical protein
MNLLYRGEGKTYDVDGLYKNGCVQSQDSFLHLIHKLTAQSTLKTFNNPYSLIMKYTAAVLALAGVSSAAVTKTLPKSAGVTSFPTAVPVKGSFDGGMKRYERSRKFTCKYSTRRSTDTDFSCRLPGPVRDW